MTSDSVLVLGGARSGKSRYGEKIAADSGLQKVYVATAEAHDDEMRQRIADHKLRRDAGWTTYDAPIDLMQCLSEHSRPGRVVLVDCLTLWLSNHLLKESDLDATCGRLAGQVGTLPGLTIFVSNEVGSGIVPDHRMGRVFRDAQGRLNQMMAEACDNVVLAVAGLPLMLKGQDLP